MHLFRAQYNHPSDTLSIRHSSGLLSNATITLFNLLWVHTEIYNKKINVTWKNQIWDKPDGLCGNSYGCYFKTKDIEAEDYPDQILDPQNNFFMKRRGRVTGTTITAITHSDHSLLNFEELTLFTDLYFSLTEEVKEREKYIIDKYKIDFDSTIAILDRGTDKGKELPKLPCEMYVDPIFENVEKYQDYNFLIQTDQLQEFEGISGMLKDNNCNHFNIEEMDMTTSNIAIHKIPMKERKQDNYELGLNYLAAISIISKCKYVFFDTSNASLWICLMRGNTDNTYQMLSSRRKSPSIFNNLITS